MRKRIMTTLLLTFLSIFASAQGVGGQVRRPERKQQTTNTTPNKKRQTSKDQKTKKPQEREPIEAAGYDVTFNSNVPSATLYIDGNNNGTANGSKFLKTGSHTIRLSADGYEPLSQSIQVNSGSSSFYFTMKKKENQMPAVIQNLVNNMVRVEGGTFTMGATSEQGSDAYEWEKPAHRVTVSSFSIGKYEVTQEEWEAVMGNNPSRFKGPKRPVESISWSECHQFIRKLRSLTGKNFRMLTEAEWEYAARGGNKSRGYKYSGSNILDYVGWYGGNSSSSTHDVGQLDPNELGLYDMSGNVWEWCADWYGSYDSGTQSNPVGPSSGSNRVDRGGGWSSLERTCRVSYRSYNSFGSTGFDLGLRLGL